MGGGASEVLPLQKGGAAKVLAIREWSLIMGRGATKWDGGGGASEVLPLQKGRGQQSFSNTDGGMQKVPTL